MSDNRISLKCKCGFEIAGPFSPAWPVVQAHLTDLACPFSKPHRDNAGTES